MKYDLISGFTGKILFSGSFEGCFDYLNNVTLSRFHSGDYNLVFESIAPYESKVTAKYVASDPVFYIKRTYN